MNMATGNISLNEVSSVKQASCNQTKKRKKCHGSSNKVSKKYSKMRSEMYGKNSCVDLIGFHQMALEQNQYEREIIGIDNRSIHAPEVLGTQHSLSQPNESGNGTMLIKDTVSGCSSTVLIQNENDHEPYYIQKSLIHKYYNSNNQRQHVGKLGYNCLQRLLEKNSHEIVTTLGHINSGFGELLNTILEPDLLIIIVKVIAKACDSQFQVNKAMLLSTICQTKFLYQVEQYIFRMPNEQSTERREIMGVFLNDLLAFFEALLNILPLSTSEKLRSLMISTDVMMKGIETYQNITLSEQRDLFCKLEKQLENILEERNTRIGADAILFCEEPPDNFREKTLYPTVDDLFKDKLPFVRPNIINGPYKNVEHYLDIQFRLLREDFIAPLREGLTTFLKDSGSNNCRRIENIRIYRDVIFENPLIVNNQIGFIVKFNTGKRMNINWEHSKRFMFGSLLLFTNNNFRSIVFATVLRHDIRELQSGKITVVLNENDNHSNLFRTKFLMIESEVYFEPYKHVMRALQGINECTFPMEKYIVHVMKKSHPPQYLLSNLQCSYTVDGHNFKVLDASWPDEGSLSLDQSQFIAFKAALSQEFVVIQGPPGTGKTFLGLKIVKTLLENSFIWNVNNKTPILVVCYTNHALDQFLEGLISETDEIVRVGGQSKSEKLGKYNLREKRRLFSFTSAYFSHKKEISRSMEHLMTVMKRIQTDLEELETMRGVVTPKLFIVRGIIEQRHFVSLTRGEIDVDVNYLMKEWLLEGIEDFKVSDVDAHDNVFASTYNKEQQVEQMEGIWQTVHHDPMMFKCGKLTHSIDYAVDLQKFEDKEVELLQLLEELNNIPPSRETRYNIQRLQEDYNTVLFTKQYWKSCLSELHERYPKREWHSSLNLWEMPFVDRWILYKDWLRMLKDELKNDILQLKHMYRREYKRFYELQQFCDLEILKNSLVVGMTTTNAARLQQLLQILEPKIVVVEEAAEVLESHIVVSLTKKCEHLILIGDHQQLRPTTTTFKLAQQYHFDISLFERMIKNGMQSYCLEKQHRMRPEISKLIVPVIYPNLVNVHNVYCYPPVRGITKSLFFVTHSVKEEEDKDTMSHINRYEADFILTLCRHLIWQGYEPQDITILTTYKEQMFYMKKRQKTCNFINAVRVTVVDNYQGEENRIVLLSIVRSNEQAKIGFLKVKNRVCVALSRAREGLYIIGNMENLVQSSKIWLQMKNVLMEQGSYGTHLTLQCQVHPDQLTFVNCAEHFRKVSEGGCSLECKTKLQCGHQCERICHVYDREHKDYKCHKKCERGPPNCTSEHSCPKLCYEDCWNCEVPIQRLLPCGHEKELPCYVDSKEYKCEEEVEVELPNCGHKVVKPCYYNALEYPCTALCRNRLPCGHSCILKCHVLEDPDHLKFKCMKPCSNKRKGCSKKHLCQNLCHEECESCNVYVNKSLPNCGHVAKVKCSDDPALVKCTHLALKILPQCGHAAIIRCYEIPAEVKCVSDCEKSLSCGHKCPKKCFENCGGCQEKVLKIIPLCGHEIKINCSESPETSFCRERCKKFLPCGHSCVSKCGKECTKDCHERIKSPVLSLCGHEVEIPCYLQQNLEMEVILDRCKVPCRILLACGHVCKGNCGSCMQGRIHIPCLEECGRNLICGHRCMVSCAAVCPPCSRKCKYNCIHSDCDRKCGEPCTPCKEKCSWRCKHLCCTQLCYEICDRNPCYEACRKLQKCGHKCLGFCGEPCPPMCRICNEDKVKEIFFGSEEDDNTRFVYLVDCGHSFESSGLEKWLQQSSNSHSEITLKECPMCKTPIMLTQRFMNIVKRTMKDVMCVKQRIFGERSEIEHERTLLLKTIQTSVKDETLRTHMSKSKTYDKILQKCISELQPVRRKRRNYLSASQLNCLRNKIHIVDDLLSTVNSCIFEPGIILKEEYKNKIFCHVDRIVEKLMDCCGKFSDQQVTDFNQECKRFLSITQLVVIQNSGNFAISMKEDEMRNIYERACQIVYSVELYSEEQHSELKDIISKLHKTVGESQFTEHERKVIVQAMKFKQGHWFKCPNGHIYCIDQCGGAMEVGKCPECGKSIGGSNHHLLTTNALASEMDGATQHAYPGGLY